MQELWTGGAWERSGPAPAPRVRIKNREKKRFRPGVLAIILTAVVSIALLGGALIYAGVMVVRYAAGPETPSAQMQTTVPRAPAKGDLRLVLEPKGEQVLPLGEIYEQTVPSIVYIRTDAEGTARAGTGIILSEDGYILTNWHIVEGASAVHVVTWDDTLLEARLVGQCEKEDVAVLKAEASGLVPARFATSADVRVGDSVAAIGNPLGGRLRATMTEGIVSAVDRPVVTDGVTNVLLQTSAAINPGSSGGALVNDRGQVIGVTCMKMMSRRQTIEGLGFAIPSQLLKGLTDQIIATGRTVELMIGLTLTEQDEPAGLRVAGVHMWSDAYEKGLRPGDVITHADGVPVCRIRELKGKKLEMIEGEELELTVLRSGRSFTVRVALMDAEKLP